MSRLDGHVATPPSPTENARDLCLTPRDFSCYLVRLPTRFLPIGLQLSVSLSGQRLLTYTGTTQSTETVMPVFV